MWIASYTCCLFSGWALTFIAYSHTRRARPPSSLTQLSSAPWDQRKPTYSLIIAAVPTLCRLPLVVSTVSDPRRHPFDAVAWAAIVPLPWPGFTDGHCCRYRVVFRRSESRSKFPVFRVTYFLLFPLFNNFSAFGQFCCLTGRVSVDLLWTSWSFTELLYLRTFFRLRCAN